MLKWAGLIALIATGGCASELRISDERGAILPGFPVRQPITFIESGEYTRLAAGGACIPSPYQSYVTQPVGPKVFVNVKPAQFAKTEFDLKLNANGGATEISLNTEPTSGEILKTVADAAKVLAPVFGLAAARPSGELTPLTAIAMPPCDTGPDPLKTERHELQLH